jgi:hypothetical protein
MKKISLLLVLVLSLSSSVTGSVTNADSVRALRGVRGKMLQADSLLLSKRDTSKVMACDTVKSKVSIRDSSSTRVMRSKNLLLRDTNSTNSIDALQVQDTLQNGSANSGTDVTLSSVYEAFKFTATANMSVYAIGLQFKRTGTITNNNSLGLITLNNDNAGTPGTAVTGASISFNLMYTTLSTSYVEVVVYKSSAGSSFVNGTSYWVIVNTGTAPTGGTVQWNTSNATVTGNYATSTNGSSWTLVDNQTGWFRLYGKTSSLFTGVGSLIGINVTVYAGTAGISSLIFGNTFSSALSGTALRGGNGCAGSSQHGYGGYFTSTDNTGVGGTCVGAGGNGGWFVGGTTTGHGMVVQKGIFTDSVIVSDSVARPTPVGGTVATTKYFGVDGDTVMTTPKIWMGITVKGVKYKIPCY